MEQQKKKETAAELEARFAEQKERWKQRIKAARAAEKKASDAKLIELGRQAEAIQQELAAVTQERDALTALSHEAEAIKQDLETVTRQRDALYAFVVAERQSQNGEKYSYWQRFERDFPAEAAEMQEQS